MALRREDERRPAATGVFVSSEWDNVGTRVATMKSEGVRDGISCSAQLLCSVWSWAARLRVRIPAAWNTVIPYSEQNQCCWSCSNSENHTNRNHTHVCEGRGILTGFSFSPGPDSKTSSTLKLTVFPNTKSYLGTRTGWFWTQIKSWLFSLKIRFSIRFFDGEI